MLERQTVVQESDINEDLSGTKRALIEAGGELFAHHGLEGVSIRMIAEKANANVTAVNYYFGSKENLYYEALKYATLATDDRPVQHYLAELDGQAGPQEALAVLERLITEKTSIYLAEGEPEWHMRLVMRSLIDPTPQLRRLVDELFRPDFEALCALLDRCRPGMSPEEQARMAFAVMGMIFFYITVRHPILMLLNRKAFDGEFVRQVAETICRTVTAGLDSMGRDGSRGRGESR